MSDTMTGQPELPAYLQKECEYLRTRLSVNIDETGALERYAVATTGALWAWFAAHPVSGSFTEELAWLPLMLTLFLGFRAIAVYYRVKQVRAYLSKLETAANVPAGLGWARSLDSAAGRYRAWTAHIFWTAINAFNFCLALRARAGLIQILGGTH